MMAGDDWTLEFYTVPSGESPVAAFLDQVDEKTRTRFRWSMEQLRVRNIQAPERAESERTDGARAYDEYWEKQMAVPQFQAVYEEEAAKKELWLQLAEARQQAGLTQQQVADRLEVSQAQVARIEKRGYDAYTLNTLRRYVQALGEGYTLRVSVQSPAPTSERREAVHA